MRYDQDNRDYYDAEIDWIRMAAWIGIIAACVWIWVRVACLIADSLT
jgi:hypothetical protein